MSRYVTTIANGGTCFDLTLIQKIKDAKSKTQDKKLSNVRNKLNFQSSTLTAIKTGMKNVVQAGSIKSLFNNVNVTVAGKTGTAQQILTRPNHALFVGYAPYEDPQVSIATRIAYGYTSSNAADLSAKVLSYYFHVADEQTLLNGQAMSVSDTANGFGD